MGSNNHQGIWFVKDYDEEYWNNYLAARPKYHRDGFYERLFSYHDTHSGGYDVAHDVGSGPGQVAAILAERFISVIASDANETHLNVGRHRNASKTAKISFILSKGEEVADEVPSGSADAIYSGEALALMDTEAAVSSFAKILKSDGTLAIWYYGRPIFAGSDRRECQELYDKIVNKKFGGIISTGSVAAWKRTSEVMYGWLDSVSFPAEIWKDVERYKWNTDAQMMFHDKEVVGIPLERRSAIQSDEKVIEIQDETMWAENWNADEVRRFVDANFPSFHGEKAEDPEVESWYAELEKTMGGKDGKRSIAWPVVLLLATKR